MDTRHILHSDFLSPQPLNRNEGAMEAGLYGLVSGDGTMANAIYEFYNP